MLLAGCHLQRIYLYSKTAYHRNIGQSVFAAGLFTLARVVSPRGIPGGDIEKTSRYRKPAVRDMLTAGVDLRCKKDTRHKRRWKGKTKELSMDTICVHAQPNGRDDRTRTCGILLPKQARYQAALHPGLQHFIYNSYYHILFFSESQDFCESQRKFSKKQNGKSSCFI